MKKSLLLVASLVMNSAAFAQWTKPVPETLKSFEYSKFAANGEGDTIRYYIYNKDAKAFLTEGNAWGTQASYGDKGLKFAITKHMEVLDGDEPEWDGKTVIINDSSEVKKAWKVLFIDSENSSYVDRGQQANYFFQLESREDGAFRIVPGDKNPDYNSEKLGNGKPVYYGISVLQNLDNTAITPVMNSDDEGKVDWYFVSEEAYAEYLPKIEVYIAAQTLKERIDEAKEKGLNVSAQEAVYNNTSSTLEELNAAIEAVNTTIKNFDFGSATEDDPMDVTEWIKNPNFDGDINGWDCTFEKGVNATNIGYQKASYENGEVKISQFIEAWTPNPMNSQRPDVKCIGDAELSQTIKNMPQGKYKFTADCIAVQQYDGSLNPVVGVQLFATGGDLDIFQNIATENGKPEHFEITFINTGDEIKMGLRTVNGTANWIAADNFTLTYYGPVKEDPNIAILQGVVETCDKDWNEEKMAEFEQGATYVGKAELEAYKAAYKAAQDAINSNDSENALNCKVTLEDASKALKSSADAYAAYVKAVEEERNGFDGMNLDEDADAVVSLINYLDDSTPEEPGTFTNGSSCYILNNCELTAAQIEAEKTYLAKLVQAAIAEGMQEGSNVTRLLVNASFKDKFTGWTNSEGKAVVGNVGGKSFFPNVECFQTVVDCQQTVTNVKPGLYKISVKAFERPGSNGSYSEEDPSIVYLFMNNFRTQISNICKGAISEEDAINEEGDNKNCMIDNPGTHPYDYLYQGTNYNGYVPNSMDGASYAFRADRYKQECYGYVGEDGIMKIGLTSDGKTLGTDCWALWADFQLEFAGKNVEALQSVLPTIVDEYTQLAKDNQSNMTKLAYDAADIAIAEAMKAETADDSEELWNAFVAVNEAQAETLKDIEAFTAMNKAYSELTEELNANPDASTEATNKYYEVDDAYGTIDQMSREQIIEFTKLINSTKILFKLPANMKEATPENPVACDKLIVNATFDTIGDFTGWAGSSFGAGGTKSTCAERYNQNYDTYQDINGVPAGYYRVSVFGFYRQGSIENDYTLNNPENENYKPAYNAVLYATTSEGETTAKIHNLGAGAVETSLGGATVDYGNGLVIPNTMESANYCFEAGKYGPEGEFNNVIVKVAEDGILRIGVKKSVQLDTDWSIFDNFKIEYLGTQAPTAVESVNVASSAAAGIYTISGAKVSSMTKGINIVKMADGSVKKVLVK